ncbi:hypothetical protein EHN07_05335 [Buttiauxella warmboldiae]|uniref:Uncharacterized protein n=1 Tax=Buttiauxella warmboldiae TaxID=82993 RepID=A0A3N5DR03_9ENTR|nr:hypothetical protein EHN07_05335 [Buttiauxella warmboldiae]
MHRGTEKLRDTGRQPFIKEKVQIRHYRKSDLKGRRDGLLPDNHKKLRIVATWGLLQGMQNSGLTEPLIATKRKGKLFFSFFINQP